MVKPKLKKQSELITLNNLLKPLYEKTILYTTTINLNYKL
jgi:hypothetical protein